MCNFTELWVWLIVSLTSNRLFISSQSLTDYLFPDPVFYSVQSNRCNASRRPLLIGSRRVIPSPCDIWLHPLLWCLRVQPETQLLRDKHPTFTYFLRTHSRSSCHCSNAGRGVCVCVLAQCMCVKCCSVVLRVSACCYCLVLCVLLSAYIYCYTWYWPVRCT